MPLCRLTCPRADGRRNAGRSSFGKAGTIPQRSTFLSPKAKSGRLAFFAEGWRLAVPSDERKVKAQVGVRRQLRPGPKRERCCERLGEVPTGGALVLGRYISLEIPGTPSEAKGGRASRQAFRTLLASCPLAKGQKGANWLAVVGIYALALALLQHLRPSGPAEGKGSRQAAFADGWNPRDVQGPCRLTSPQRGEAKGPWL